MFFTHSAQAIEKNREFYIKMYDPHHPLVLLETVIDWAAILQAVLPYYSMSRTGRSTVDPIVLIKMLFIQARKDGHR